MKSQIAFAGVMLAFSSTTIAADSKDYLIPVDAMFAEESITIPEVNNLGQYGKKNGVSYSFFHSTSNGYVDASEPGLSSKELQEKEQMWGVGCKKDIMDDEISCHAFLHKLFILKSDNALKLTIVDRENYPRKLSYLRVRVDKGEVFSSKDKTFFSKEDTREILGAINNGSQVAIRYYDDETQREIDDTYYVYNLDTALEYMEWASKVAN